MQQEVRAKQKQEAMTRSQSLLAVQTVLSAGLGCIAFLRGLFPDESFNNSHLTSNPELGSDCFMVDGDLPPKDGRSKRVSSVSIRTLKRGYSTEGDRILDYLEIGIFDAIEKEHLRSFVFAIYLDDEDPHNLVEAYTFRFSYHKLPGSNVSIPIMALDSQMKDLSMHGSSTRDKLGPQDSIVSGNSSPTLGDVRKSIQTMIRSLITGTQILGDLPGHRIVTFKLCYNDSTPESYEPPHFIPVKEDDTRLFFTTHDALESPERLDFEPVETPFHSVQVSMASVTPFLPISENDHEAYTGLQNASASETRLAPPSYQTDINAELDRQKEDASQRVVVWAADDTATGAVLGNVNSNRVPSLSVAPIGIRDPGTKEMRSITAEAPLERREFVGSLELAPTHDISRLSFDYSQPFIETQSLSLASPPIGSGTEEEIAEPSKDGMKGIQTPDSHTYHMHTLRLADAVQAHFEVLGTQNVDSPAAFPKIRVDGYLRAMDLDGVSLHAPSPPYGRLPSRSAIADISMAERSLSIAPQEEADETIVTMACICGDPADDSDVLACDGGCQKWFHVWCFGFHSSQDSRLPAHFECFECRLAKNAYISFLSAHEKELMFAELNQLALMRRTLKVVMEEGLPTGPMELASRIGCGPPVATQMMKRLVQEGFITDEDALVDCMITGRTRRASVVPKKTRQVRMKRGKQIVVRTPAAKMKMAQYFKPGGSLERNILAVVKSNFKTLDHLYTFPVPHTNSDCLPTMQRNAPSGKTKNSPSTETAEAPQSVSKISEKSDSLYPGRAAGIGSQSNASAHEISKGSNVFKRPAETSKDFNIRKKLKISMAERAVVLDDDFY